jgi:hypothetical protein
MWKPRVATLEQDPGYLNGWNLRYPPVIFYFSEATSMTKRYFTSLLSRRS